MTGSFESSDQTFFLAAATSDIGSVLERMATLIVRMVQSPFSPPSPTHRVVDHRRRLLSETVIAHVADNADDGVPGLVFLIMNTGHDTSTEGAVVWPKFLREVGAYDHRTGWLLVVARLEGASFMNRYPERLEKTRGCVVAADDRRYLVGRERVIFQHQSVVALAVGHRQVGDGSDTGHSRKALELRHQLFVEACGIFGLRIFAAGKREPHRQQVLGLEARMDATELPERARHQAGADEQNQRQRHLRDHERTPRPMGLTTHRRTKTSLVDGVDDVRPPVTNHGNEPEEKARGQRHEGGKEKHLWGPTPLRKVWECCRG